MEAVVYSFYPTKRSILCDVHMSFTKPDISPVIQYICISHQKWDTYRDVELPIEVELCGTKSF
jgi:hypothetical protein